MNFLTIGDKNYFHTILFSAKQIKKIYPKSILYIYNWGFTEEQISELKSFNNVSLIKWNRQFYNVNIKDINVFKQIKFFLGFSNFKNLIYKIFFGNEKIFNLMNIGNLIKNEMNFYNKFLCIENHVINNSDNFTFIDGDAFLIKEVNELINSNFDIGITVRRKKEFNYDYNNCNIINAGIIVFKGKKIKNFISEWRKEIDKTTELYIEQTALTRMLYNVNKDIFNVFRVNKIVLNNNNFNISILPCEIYNYNWIEKLNEENIKNIKILHFKGGRHTKENFNKLINKIKI